MTARELVIASFTSSNRLDSDKTGLALMLSVWMDWHGKQERPKVQIVNDRYRILCATKAHAERLCVNFGGVVEERTVIGAVVDLTA